MTIQSRKLSLVEANVNTWIGLIGSWLITFFCTIFIHKLGIFWYTNLVVGLCTLWSLLRGYYVRRYFNNLPMV